MKPYALLIALLAIAIIPAVSAGTLISGSEVEVRSNFGGLDCGDEGCIVGTWQNTPSVNDRLLITNLVIPEPYEIRQSAEILFKKPTYEQAFAVRNQKRVLEYAVSHQTFSYTNLPGFGESSADICLQEYYDYRSQVENDRPLMSGFEPIRLRLGTWSCEIIWVTQTGQDGWYGSVTEDQLFYEQDIAIDGVDTFRLARTQTPNGVVEDALVDTIPNLGRMTLLSFGDYTRASLSDSNVWAYHSRNEQNTDTWRAFDGPGVIVNYEGFVNSVRAADDNILSLVSTNDISELNNQISILKSDMTKLNQAAGQISTNSGTLPSDWRNKGVQSTRTASNLIIANPPLNSVTSNVQFILTGDDLGLYIPTGECTIRNVDDRVQWLETDVGELGFTVENTGTDTASLRVTANCGSTQINPVPLDFAVQEGVRQSGILPLTGRAQGFDDTQTFSCTFSCLEKNTGQEDTETFSAVVERKQLCVEGEETAPALIGDNWVVDVLDSSCDVKNRKLCDADTSEFQLQQGTYICVELDDLRPTDLECSDSIDNDGDGLVDMNDPGCTDPRDDNEADSGDFSVGSFVFALIGGLVAFFLMVAWTAPLGRIRLKGNFRSFTVVVKVLRWVLAVGVGIMAFILIGVIISGIVSLFTFG